MTRSVDHSTLHPVEQYKICHALPVLQTDKRMSQQHPPTQSEKDRGRELGRKREADGLQPYMDKALLFPGFVALTPGTMPDATQTAPQRHQVVQLMQC
ncbi:hypothetical protein NQZ68_007902 [Dissostichus eleginoides]|nr:hypothetical protein NQZ68_007902 [Dissostichus eleginoides]